MTALHYVVLKIARNEESYITKAFFKSFKQNFKQATIIWLIMLAFIAVWVGDLFIFRFAQTQFPKWLQIALWAIGAIAVFATMHIFPVLSKFDNSIKNTFKNSLYMGILSLPKTILMIVCWIIPIFITVYFLQILPIVIAFGISGPAMLCALLYNKTFKRFEPEEEPVTSDADWTVLKDDDESIEVQETESKTE